MNGLRDAGVRKRLSGTSGEKEVCAPRVDSLEFFGKGARGECTPTGALHICSQTRGDDGAWIS